MHYEINIRVYYLKDNSHEYCIVAGQYVSRLIRPQFKRKRYGRFYFEIKLRVYFLKDNRYKYFIVARKYVNILVHLCHHDLAKSSGFRQLEHANSTHCLERFNYGETNPPNPLQC